MTGLKKVSGGIERSIQGMLDRSRAVQGFLNTVIYREYQNAQRSRWMSENQSQGNRWDRINKGYAEYKLQKFAAYPGGGRKMMIATGRLQKSVIGPSTEQRKLATPTRLTISSSVSYAAHADEARTFTEFSDEFKERMNRLITDFIAKGKR